MEHVIATNLSNYPWQNIGTDFIQLINNALCVMQPCMQNFAHVVVCFFQKGAQATSKKRQQRVIELPSQKRIKYCKID